MKKIVLFVLIAFVFYSCSKKSEEPDEITIETIHIYTIEPYKEDCQVFLTGAIFPTECFVVITDEGEKKKLSTMTFKEFEKGYRYQVEVLKSETKINRELYIDEYENIRTSYIVTKILKKTKVE
ncbi:hypothetical protein [Capnocytophaga catalasegens]|uniref:DUF4377 domain-containing protein n=1 Tax=Capnocytophaga catalasegens TaxID=1004260 RepID=A0AAV5AVD9_9FLAO|nr:hypothetical protein [Capnocytophaga catalasegens]GIZ14936.1 hypothetical protein RCZ03_09360 [Capnocytophaga catalasegens]GJM49315.1 hypothetical protein RCZ15_02900 [Capnocytophaga catalasegens]GJM52466.1 hypothetical protein RCZ16_07830 [Capnocytophaga catalasegens]